MGCNYVQTPYCEQFTVKGKEYVWTENFLYGNKPTLRHYIGAACSWYFVPMDACLLRRCIISLLLTGDPCQPSDPGASVGHSQPLPVKRGPGRPRLRPVGPGHQGTRGTPRPRKAPRPLPVPLRSGCVTPSSVSTVPSSAAAVEQPRPFGFYTQETGPTEWAGNAGFCRDSFLVGILCVVFRQLSCFTSNLTDLL